MRILRGLSSRVLSCGCLAGVYETYDGEIVALVDAHAPQCADQAHRAGDSVPVSSSRPVPPPRPGLPDERGPVV